METDLSKLTDAEFSEELDHRIEQVDAAWKAVQEVSGPHLEHLATPAAESDRIWAEMEASERQLEEGWRELSRRKDLRLGRAI